MANKNANKVVLGGSVLIDLTQDSVTADSLLSGVTAHDKSGNIITGTLLSDFKSEIELPDSITDSSGNSLLDSSGASITGARKYRMV